MSTPNPLAGGSLSDILSAIQNLVQAINGATTNYTNINGAVNFSGISIPTLVKSKPGRICEISIIAAGTTPGIVYDASTPTDTSHPIIPLPNTVGLYRVTFPVSFGILIIPGIGQTIAGSYS